MADNALQPAVVDVPIGSLNQTPSDHAGPTGRLTLLYDAVIRHYDANGGKRVLLDPRNGFTALENGLHNSVTGGVQTSMWANPSFLFALGDQLLSICSNVPRVFNGSDWTNYQDRRIVTQKLSESVLHATNSTIAAQDHAWISGTTCTVWTEQVFDSAGVLNTSAWVSFRADDGAWYTVPSQLHTGAGASSEYATAKVVQDGLRFWVFYNSEVGGHKIYFNLYSQNGGLISSSNVARNWNASPGYWDVYGSFLAGVILAQPLANGTGGDVGVQVKKISWNGSSFVTVTGTLAAAHCQGPVAWLTNDLTGTSVYLATLGPAETGGLLWAYEINSSMASTHEYDFAEVIATLPDNMTGWAEETGVGGQRHVYISYSMLTIADGATGGAPYDPQRRYIITAKGLFSGSSTRIKQTNSVVQQSRAFAINGEYHAYTYYQSGSGQSLPSAPQVVSHTAGDFFRGASEQAIAVKLGDYTEGAPFAIDTPTLDIGGGLVPSVLVSAAVAATGIVGTDSVSFIVSGIGGNPSLATFGIPDGTFVLKWIFTNGLPGVGATTQGGQLVLTGSSIPSANTTPIDVYFLNAAGTKYVITPLTNINGGVIIPGAFAAGGTYKINAFAGYRAVLTGHVDAGTKGFFSGSPASIQVSGNSDPNDNGTFTIGRCVLAGSPGSTTNPIGSFGLGPAIWVPITTQIANAQNPNPFHAVITPVDPNVRWSFADGDFIDNGSFLIVDGAKNAANDNTDDGWLMTAVGGTTCDTNSGDAVGVIAEMFSSPFPTVKSRLAGGLVPYVFFLQSVTFDYRYINAQISVAGATHPTTNGIYTIAEIINSHTVRVTPTNGRNDQRSEMFSSGPTIVIQLATNVQPQGQPTWFITPLTGRQPQVGAFEKGLAFADWRFDGNSTAATLTATGFAAQDRYRFDLTSTSNPFGTIRQVVLPFRVTSFTQVSIATVGATPIDIANTAEASTVGLKIFRSQGTGEGTGDARKLLVPGLLAAEFTPSGFAENNFNVGPEAPFVVSEATDSTTNFALTPGAVYTYQVVVARTLESGDVVRSLPSPAIQVTMTGTNNVATVGGRTLMPNNPGVIFGVTNHPQVTYEIYRSVVINGVPSTQLHMITNPGNPNGLYSGSGTGSGFIFPDDFTWQYRDENPDAGIQATEVIYAGTLGQGIAPHFPCPPFTHATTWANRRWVVGYDGAVWMSAELQEGEDTWFFPGFRYPFPEEDPAVCVVGFENFLFMFCAKSIWRIGLSELPNATLTSGAMPTPIRLPWSMGCSGFAVAMSDVVAYSSSVQGGEQVWAITRNLANEYLSEPIQDTFNDAFKVSGMAVDGFQRLLVLGGDFKIRVYDPVPQEWSVWRMPTAPILITHFQKQPTYQDSGFVLQQSDSAVVDSVNGVDTPIALDATLSSLTFTSVRSVKRLWEVQIIGENSGGPSNINAVIKYPDEIGQPATTFGPTLVTGTKVLFAINPAVEQASAFEIRIFGSFEGFGDPGRCFSLEMLSCEVGLDSRMGVGKLPDSFRLVGR